MDEEDFPKEFPLSYAEIKKHQDDDAEVKKLLRNSPEKYSKKAFHRGDKTYDLMVKEDKIVLPKALQKRATEWYHAVLMHPGETRTELTIVTTLHLVQDALHGISKFVSVAQACQLKNEATLHCLTMIDPVTRSVQDPRGDSQRMSSCMKKPMS